MKNLISFAFTVMSFAVFSAFTTDTNAPYTQPDLFISEAKVVCSQNVLVVKIANGGSVKSNQTLLRIRPKDQDDPTQRCIQKSVEVVPQIQPGKDVTLRMPLKKSAGCNCTGPLQFELVVDHLNYILEVDETNNTYILITGV